MDIKIYKIQSSVGFDFYAGKTLEDVQGEYQSDTGEELTDEVFIELSELEMNKFRFETDEFGGGTFREELNSLIKLGAIFPRAFAKSLD